MTHELKHNGGRWIRWWAGLVVAVVLSLPGAVFWWRSQDIGRRDADTADLVLAPLVVPAEDDAFTHFERAARAVRWSAMSWKDFQEDCAKRLGQCETLLADNAEALRHLRRGLACKVCVGPQDWNEERPFPFVEMKRLDEILAIQARLHLRDGQGSEAVAGCRELVRYGELLCQRPSGLVMLLVGRAVSGRGLETARLIANQPGITEEELTELAELLDGFAPPEEGMAIAVRAEFMMASVLIDRLESGDMAWQEIGEFKKHPLINGYQFQPNRTRRLLAERARAALAALNQPMTMSGSDDEEDREEGGRIGHNIVGRTLVGLWGSSAANSNRKRAQVRLFVDGARLVVALRRFETRTGALPATMEALVPDYLPSVPGNPLTGKPLRYDPGKRVIVATNPDGGRQAEFSLRLEVTP